MPFLVDHLDFAGVEARNLVSQNLAAPPSNPVRGQRYFDTTLLKAGSFNGVSWEYFTTSAVVSVAVTAPLVSTGGTTPTISISPASGSLAGSMSISDFIKLGASTAANTPNALVQRDASGNIAVGTVTGNLTGTASNATTLNSQAALFYLTRANHTGTQPSSSISDFDTQVRASRLDQLASPTSAVSLNNQRITAVATPTLGSDAVNKDYADALISTGNNKGEARVVATGNIAIATPGTAIDGVTLVNGNQILLIGQTTAAENGLYVFNGAAIPLTRATSSDTTAEVKPGMFVFVSEGSVNNISNGYTLTTPNPIVLGTTALTFIQTSGAGQITAGLGLTKTGNVLNAGAGIGITVNADDIAINTAVVARKFAQLIGDGASTVITVTHNLNNAVPNWVCVQAASPFNSVVPSVAFSTANTTTFTFAVAPTTNQYRVGLTG